MNTSKAWVELALKILSCNQKDLARRVAVSPTQISKWKNGEHMSTDMEDKFRALVDIGEKHPEFVLWADSLEDADKWDRLIHRLAEEAQDSAETGYNTEPLQDDLGLLCVQVSDTLSNMGVEPPEVFPPELDRYFNGVDGSGDDEADDDDPEAPDPLWELLETNPYSAAIHDIFESLNDVWGFYVAYVAQAIDDDDLSLVDTTSNIEACLMDLAACKIQVDEKFAPKFRTFRYRVMKDYQKWLTAVKDAAFRTGTPLRAELLDMVSDTHGELGHTAEAESLGFNASRLHPDIYMNELLVGMRIIHQVLPAILKKLDINDFELDESSLHINMNPYLAYADTADDETTSTADE
ncbi:helix-turn-helix domain-containing protein [Tunturiibacter gelidoferens]|uniref:Helix-turn-helix transcriptional regulator n=1 Tax=Tunturiibacter gelidiferens TaxID=3069689 RepID=A0AAU7YXV1_9BACT